MSRYRVILFLFAVTLVGALSSGRSLWWSFTGALFALNLKTDEKKHEISEDEHKRLAAEVQKMTDNVIADIDAAAHSKEQEILGK